MGGCGPGAGRSGAFSPVILLLIPAGLSAICDCCVPVEKKEPEGRSQEPGARSQKVSILKPVSGAGGNLRAALASHAGLDAELLCGVRSLDDPAVAIIREFPGVRLIECSTVTANAKVGVLIDLVRAATYETIIVNDSDICVAPDYLARVTGPLADPKVGLVTCLYRAVGDTFSCAI